MKKFFYLCLLLFTVSPIFCACSDDDDDLSKTSNLVEGSTAYNQVVDSLCATPAFADTFHLSTEQFMSFYKFQKDGTMNIFVCSDANLDGEADMDTLNLSWKIEEKPAEVDKGYKCYYLKLTFDMSKNNYNQSLIDTIEVKGGATVASDSLIMKVADNGEVNLYGHNEESTRGILSLLTPFIKVLQISTNIYSKHFSGSYDTWGPEIYADWMSHIYEGTPLNKLSIPGSHASFSFELWNVHSYDIVQDFDVETQWSMGVRCFDMDVQGSRVIHTSPYTYSEYKMSIIFNGTTVKDMTIEMDKLKALLQQHTGETAIVIVNVPDGQNSESTQEAMDSYIQQLIDEGTAAKWTPGITLAEARGHIIFVTRYASQLEGCVGKASGLSADGTFADSPAWGNNLSNSYLVSGPQSDTYESLSKAGQVARLYVQDYASQVTPDVESFYTTKKQLFTDNIDYLNQHINDAEPVWAINYMSGTVNNGLNLVCAEVMNPYLEEKLNGQYKDKYLGIILVDWAGLSRYMGSVFDTLHNSNCNNIPSLILKHNK